jgi:ABC-type uncharacterized transport system permease subunit
MFMLNVNSTETPAWAALLAALSVAGIFVGAAINQLPKTWHNITIIATIMMNLIFLIMLYYQLITTSKYVQLEKQHAY